MKRFLDILHFFRRENLHRLLLLLLVMITLSSVALVIFEPGISLLNAFWLSIVTLTTVGYGDITPTTLAGRIVGIFIMLFGIGILGMFTASIASIFVEKKLKEDRGMHTYDFSNHIIICTWHHGTPEIIKELRSDTRIADSPIVLLAELETKPINDPNLYFIKGAVSEENLKKANIEKAQTVIILGDDKLEANARDAKVVLSTLTVEDINPNVYTIVELVNENNARHCQRAKADEIIVGSEFSCRLISRAATDHGISKVISELLSSRKGEDIYKVRVPKILADKPFLEVFTYMKKENGSIVLAIQESDSGVVTSNPDNDKIIKPDDSLIVIANRKPEIS
jgi:voltage-gated potassium channel